MPTYSEIEGNLCIPVVNPGEEAGFLIWRELVRKRGCEYQIGEAGDNERKR